jgi:uncharacterized membrane protein (GlpM family)
VDKHEIVVAFVSGLIAWMIGKLMDLLLDMWRRRRRTPLTNAQVKRYHRSRLIAAVVPLAWCLATLGWIAVNREVVVGPVDWTIIAGLVALAIYMARVARRRWLRLRSSK